MLQALREREGKRVSIIVSTGFGSVDGVITKVTLDSVTLLNGTDTVVVAVPHIVVIRKG